MNEELERRTIAFLRTLAEPCRMCMRRNRCNECSAGWAKHLLREIELDNGPQKEPDYSISARFLRIMNAIKKANGPIASDQIDMEGTCSRQLKYWTLCALTKQKRISRTKINGRYVYKVNQKGNA